MTKNELKHLFRELENIFRHYSITKSRRWQEQQEQYKIIKSMHTIEKGLSLKNIKIGFGVPKVIDLLNRIEKYYNNGFDCSHESVQMAMGAIDAYAEFHTQHNALNEEIKAKYEKLNTLIKRTKNIGGADKYYKADILNFNAEEFNKVVLSRHSIRNFSEEKVDIDAVKAAIELAKHCPSACNRQPTKIHIVEKEEDIAYLSKRLQGAGGFADDCKMYLVVTGSVSAFGFMENNQWIVSAGIFVGTLELALHSKGIASCVIQRPLVWSKDAVAFREYLNLPDNEELVCMIGLGMYPEEFFAPSSARLPLNDIVKFK